MSIQKMARGPMMLVDREFNIPLFQANSQMYVCTEVSETGSDSSGKKYAVFFKEIHTGFSVPEVVRLDITIPIGFSNNIKIEMYEKRPNGNYIQLFTASVPTESIQSLKGIKKMLVDLVKDKC